MIFQTSSLNLFVPFAIGAFFFIVVGLGSILAAEHPLERARTAFLNAWIRRIVGVFFMVIGIMGIFNISQVHLYGAIRQTSIVKDKIAYSCGKSSTCYAIRLEKSTVIELEPNSFNKIETGLCYNFVYYQASLPLHTYSNIPLAKESQSLDKCS